MKPKKEDRRIRKTKAMLQKALISLLNTKNIQDISVLDLTEEADINRGTFYLHYRDVFQVMEEVENEYLEKVTGLLDEIITNSSDISNKRDELMLITLEYFYDNKEITKILLMNKGRVIFHTKFKNMLNDYIDRSLKSRNIQNELLKYYIAFVISGIIGVVQEWVKDDFDKSPEELAMSMQLMIQRQR